MGAGLVGYLLLALMAEGLPPRGAQHNSITAFLVVITALWLLYLSVVLPLVRGKRLSKGTFWSALIFAFVARAMLLPTDLILENDIYRYIWDGKVIAHGINPYLYPPLSGELAHLRGGTWEAINFPYIRTIYPPVLQAVFFLSYLVYPDSVIGMKLILTGFDAGTVLLLVRLLQNTGKSMQLVLVYAWCPLVIREVANAGHADAITAFFVVLFLLTLVEKRRIASGFVLALLIMTKLYAVLFIPLLMRRIGWRQTLAVPAWILLGYTPFMGAGKHLFSGLYAYSTEWRYNAGAYELVRLIWGILEPAWIDPGQAARYSSAAIVFIICGIIWLRSRSDDSLTIIASQLLTITGSLLFFSPVIDPWYLLWLVPLLVYRPNGAWLFLIGAVQWSYAFYYSLEFPFWTRPAEYIPFAILLYAGYVRSRIRKPCEAAMVQAPQTPEN